MILVKNVDELRKDELKMLKDYADGMLLGAPGDTSVPTQLDGRKGLYFTWKAWLGMGYSVKHNVQYSIPYAQKRLNQIQPNRTPVIQILGMVKDAILVELVADTTEDVQLAINVLNDEMKKKTWVKNATVTYK